MSAANGCCCVGTVVDGEGDGGEGRTESDWILRHCMQRCIKVCQRTTLAASTWPPRDFAAAAENAFLLLRCRKEQKLRGIFLKVVMAFYKAMVTFPPSPSPRSLCSLHSFLCSGKRRAASEQTQGHGGILQSQDGLSHCRYGLHNFTHLGIILIHCLLAS